MSNNLKTLENYAQPKNASSPISSKFGQFIIIYSKTNER